jgi:hypothetical protein
MKIMGKMMIIGFLLVFIPKIFRQTMTNPRSLRFFSDATENAPTNQLQDSDND